MKANQDAFVVRKDVAGEPDTMFFGVFDGHGSCGTDCAQFARDKVDSGRRLISPFCSGPLPCCSYSPMPEMRSVRPRQDV